MVKRLCDPSLQPWSEDALAERDVDGSIVRGRDASVPSLTILLPCYMPNEQDLVEETIDHILTKLRYPRSFTLVVCYNTPRPLPIEETLAEMDGSAREGACAGTLNTLKVLKVTESTSKAHNLNAALSDVETDNVAIYDADTTPTREPRSSRRTCSRTAACAGSTYLRKQDTPARCHQRRVLHHALRGLPRAAGGNQHGALRRE